MQAGSLRYEVTLPPPRRVRQNIMTTETKQPTGECLRIRVHGEADQPTLIYLPGLHGDWTLVPSFRIAMGDLVRFVEFTYPRTLDWSLEDYADNVGRMLVANGIVSGWVIAESFGSQVAWPLVAERSGGFRAEGLILAGGFGRHPLGSLVHLGGRFCSGVPLGMVTRALFWYEQLSKFRFRNAPAAREGLKEFIARRTELDKQAGAARLRLIADNHPEKLAARISVPVFYLTGFWDPIVPWPPVMGWLRRNCSTYRGARIIGTADHTVLVTGVRKAARYVSEWMSLTR